MRIAIGSIQCEGNSLTPVKTKYSDFDYAKGEAMYEKIQVMDFFREHNCEIVPTIYAHALPGGAVIKEDFLRLAGELVMIGIAPRFNGYAGTFGDTIPVNGVYTQKQKDLLNHMRETFRLTREMLKPGMSGREIDVPGRLYYEKHSLSDYIVCPFAHSIGLMEAESPFFGPNGDFVLIPGMTIMVDVSFFGHPDLHGGRIETGFVITENGSRPLSSKMCDYFMKDL